MVSLVLGAIICYIFFQPLYDFLARPMLILMKQHPNWKFVFTSFHQPFFVVLKISIIAGFVLAAPFITWQLWLFIAPALTREEKKPLKFVAPLSIFLFLAGVTIAYLLLRFAIHWFIGYVNYFPNAVLYQDPETYVLFVLKMLAAFGLVFQLPVVLMFLAWVGIINSKGMVKYWRHSVVSISVVGAIVTPSNDAFTMLMMILPVIGLYFASISLVKLVERVRKRPTA
ncbi:MAG: twin-arginine translocase subunit TatC [Armatimonadetes bacterium]|nr:twin-arginine translocase subunit TatC [Armatimonadota bacterium]